MGIVVWDQSPAKNRAQPRKEVKSRCPGKAMQKRVFTVWNEFSLDWLCVARLTRLWLLLFYFPKPAIHGWFTFCSDSACHCKVAVWGGRAVLTVNPMRLNGVFLSLKPSRVIARKGGHTGQVTRASFKLRVTLAWVGRLHLRLRSCCFS